MRLLHISDVHFGPKHLPEVAEGVLRLVAERRPEAVILSGDLTQRAKEEQFRQARAFVDRLEAPTLVVPGNHDVPLYRRFFTLRMFNPYGPYRSFFADDLEPVMTLPGMTAVGVNTAFGWTTKHGRVTTRQLRRLEERLAAIPQDHLRVVVAHHELIPAPRFGTQRVLRNAWEMADLCSRQRVDLVLSGHLHQAYLGSTEQYYAFGREPVWIVHSGTTSSSRGRGGERGVQSCHWIECEGQAIEVTPLRWQGESGRFEAYGRQRVPRRPPRAVGSGRAAG
ncbi:MAG: metallophosphoesterase family protein [Acidobacteriota bacterium]